MKPSAGSKVSFLLRNQRRIRLNQKDSFHLLERMDLKERISSLPHAIQILIGEFNVDHRRQVQAINREYLTLIYPLCRICSAPFDKVFCTLDYFILKKFKLNCHWCGLECFEKDTDRELKLRCLHAVEEYIEE